MAAHGKLRRERGLQAEYEAQVKEMRWQLSEQLRCLELQGELRRELLQELAEFMRRRAEVELEYSRGLDKLAERFSGRGGRLGGSSREHQSFRKEPSLLSPLHCWAVLLQQTRQQSRESATLSEVLAGPLAQRLSHIAEDVGRIVKRSKDLEQQLQDELLEVVSELQTAKKTYQVYHMESVNAEAKLREAERQEEKRAGRSAASAVAAAAAAAAATATATEAGPLRKSSLKKGGRLVEKRQAKFLEHKLKCTKARNEYLLSLASVNAAVSNYYLRDVLDLMDCCDTGFHLALGQVLRSYTAAESRTQASQMQGLGSLEEAVEALDPPGDKAKVLEVHAVAFCPPLRFDYHPHEGDEVRVTAPLRDEILPRAQNIQSRLDRQTIETEEVSKTLKATLQALLEVVASEDGDVLDSLQASPSTESLKSTSSDPGARQAGRRRGQQQETETFYIMKLQEYLSGRSILAKLQAKHEKLQEAIERGGPCLWPSTLLRGDPISGQPVPLVVESCVRFINLNGLQHEGIFRVSGAQPRVSEIREAFERGEDPLVEGCTAHDLDSVAGVLKLYFRSLDPPLFPPDLFKELLAVAERVEHVSRLLAQLPGPVLVVLRYLFAFLNHLAQYSDENMMDPYNLAVCFGPTLLPVPAGQDPVALQGRVNQLVQTLIVQPARVFPPPTLLPGPIYEKCMAPPSTGCLGYARRVPGWGVQQGEPSRLLRCLALTSGTPSWRAWLGRTSRSWKPGPRPRRMVRGRGGGPRPVPALGAHSPSQLGPPSLPRPGRRRGGRGLLFLHGPHGPGAELPARGCAAAVRAGVGRLVAGRVRGRPGAHSPQVHHAARGVSELLLVHPGLWPFPCPSPSLPRPGRPRPLLANTGPAGPQSLARKARFQQAVPLTLVQRSTRRARGHRSQRSW
uniref:Rho GTPase activating protein 4 n=1 Tax=Canis lupus dingo TaxID=286419 RepID=A0A8C0LFT1_CANLU